jgi:polyisoprenoid-binding protein YceI
MSVTQSVPGPAVEVLEGNWRVDPNAGELTFSSRGVFGLVPVRGRFGAYEGELEVGGSDARGELRIDAATLDTKNKKRDDHLRSADFFHATEYPTVKFVVNGLETVDGNLELSGILRIRDNDLVLKSPVQVSRLDTDRVRLDTKLSVDREAAGVGWSKMGAIQGKAHLGATIVLVRD